MKPLRDRGAFSLIGLKELDELKQLYYPLDSTKRKKKRKTNRETPEDS